ncbi:LmbE family protein [Janibacter hoylei PVAS-1]|uniref:LmbE family protein n=1 Tax=Janibacter hoylei PVAS-1 TaxID=1210046 RepID=K1E0X6_9MICO|nr:PIG-L family deacetylase [Janibacter hoylei]EKA62540.1 LmbE family protein [Janibacter hoylei PVAS-1]RWU84715.1 PIG-L domain-containing protein [Janibacter hoylei PVAS-1]
MDSAARTLVVFHAHPDDEALLTAGTMARAAAEGHRVVLVVATDGALGETDETAYGAKGDALASTRSRELAASARALGVARTVELGHADSGSGPEVWPDPPGGRRFVRVPIDDAASALADVLVEERADVLTTYDPHGGYGHRDHVRVHEVGARAAELARERGLDVRVLWATVPRDLICRAIDLVAKVYRFPPEFDRASFDRAFAAKAEITHRIPVRRFAAAKRASMRAHASQAAADGGGDRTLGMLVRIPRPLYDLVFGREWFVDPEAPGTAATDVFEGRA